MSGTNGITCQLCHEKAHVMQTHLAKSHPEITPQDYQQRFPLAPMLSPDAEDVIRKRKGQQPTCAPEEPNVQVGIQELFLHDVFGLGTARAARNARGDAIKIHVFDRDGHVENIPDKDPGYIFNIDLTKTVIMALEMGIPLYLWGHSGVGKTTVLEQVCAFTNRRFLRVQHTANTEEADVEGQWKVINGEMTFELGPLPQAMLAGHVYCADEYDFANPQVLSVYQAVLEGKPLHIKSANRVIRPHPNFRFVATGNTNGAGDDSGLYMGTQIQNAANYERFGLVHKVEYMPEVQEVGVLRAKIGLDEPTAAKLVEFARMIRAAFDRREVSIPLSPRALLFAARLGLARNDFKFGIESSYINRLPSTSAEFAKQMLQRHFS